MQWRGKYESINSRIFDLKFMVDKRLRLKGEIVK